MAPGYLPNLHLTLENLKKSTPIRFLVKLNVLSYYAPTYSETDMVCVFVNSLPWMTFDISLHSILN